MEKHEIPQVIRNSKSLPELIANLRAPVYYDRSMRMHLDSRAGEKQSPLKVFLNSLLIAIWIANVLCSS